MRRVEYDLRGVLEGSLYKVVQERGDCDTTPRSIEEKNIKGEEKKRNFSVWSCVVILTRSAQWHGFLSMKVNVGSILYTSSMDLSLVQLPSSGNLPVPRSHHCIQSISPDTGAFLGTDSGTRSSQQCSAETHQDP